MAERKRFIPRITGSRAHEQAVRDAHAGQVLIIGLGRFGSSLGTSLVSLGHEVLGIDSDPRIVQEHADALTHVVAGDATDVRMLDQLGARDFSVAVVAIGTDIESSVLSCAALADLGLENIWAKAITAAHARILERVGAHHVVFPEQEMGERVAHLVTGRMMDYIELDTDFALVETSPPSEIVGRALGEVGVRANWDVTVVCIKPAGGHFTYATADTVVREGDILLVAGSTSATQAFADAD